jgi:protein required for attachment to host cells
MFCGYRLHAVDPHKTLIRAAPRYPVEFSWIAVMSKSEKRQRNKWLKLRCTEEEVEVIQVKAVAAGLSVSELLRRSALNRKIMTRTDMKLMNELLRLGGLQKHLHNQMKDGMTTELSKQFSEVLVALKKAVIQLDLQAVPVGE